jgi:hypothetical protein
MTQTKRYDHSLLGPCERFDLIVVVQDQENAACMLGQLGRPKTAADVSAVPHPLCLGCT